MTKSQSYNWVKQVLFESSWKCVKYQVCDGSPCMSHSELRSELTRLGPNHQDHVQVIKNMSVSCSQKLISKSPQSCLTSWSCPSHKVKVVKVVWLLKVKSELWDQVQVMRVKSIRSSPSYEGQVRWWMSCQSHRCQVQVTIVKCEWQRACPGHKGKIWVMKFRSEPQRSLFKSMKIKSE